MQWSDLFAALALVMIIEGLLPFASPTAMRRAMLILAGLDESRLRTAGLVSMIAGLLLLYLVRFT
jgi:uncharacterized protein YjeT (DUF2065 family)